MPFRAGDWKCGRDGCFYHNFAKNVSCLRCGAPRQEAAVVAEGGGGQHYQGSSYAPTPNMSMGSMGGSSYGAMTPASDAYGSNPMGGPPGGFGAQSFGPPSTYALPSGLGAPSPYMTGGYGQMPPTNQGGGQAPGGFDSRTEQAFNQGNQSATGGAQGGGYAANGGNYGGNNAGSYGNDASDVSLAFLNAGMGNLGFGERDERRNGGQGGAKSPQ